MFGLKKTQPKIHKKQLYSLGVLITLVVVLSTYFVHLLSKPATGVIMQTSSKSETTQNSPQKKLSTDYFSVMYPSKYILQSNNNSASLQSWIFIAHQSQQLSLGQASKISLSIVNLPEGGVKEDSAYKHFLAFPEFYSVSNLFYSGEQVVVSERTNPSFEQTVLWTHSKYLLTASLTSAEKTEALTSELDAMLRSLVWDN